MSEKSAMDGDFSPINKEKTPRPLSLGAKMRTFDEGKEVR
jgi:hypothetical protein